MTKDSFGDEIKLLSGFFGAKWPPEALTEAWERIKDLSDAALIQAHKRIFVEFPPKPLPAIGRIMAVIEDEQKKLNLANSPAEPKSRQQEDRDFNEQFQKQFGKSHDEYIKRCWHVINLTLNPEVPRERIIEACGIMESAYPGLGWQGRELAEIRKYRDSNPTHFQEALQ